jgi:predicted GNAT superfamily acetyltransferase
VKVIIRKILTQDIDTILELNEKSVKVLSPMDKGKLLRLIEISALSAIVEEANQVAGFLLAFTHDVQYESINYEWFNHNYDSFLYIDRIVIAEPFRAKGMATKLYEYAFDWAVEHSLPRIFAEIDVMPPNEPSLLFHKKFGFKELELLQHNQHKMVSLQECKVG